MFYAGRENILKTSIPDGSKTTSRPLSLCKSHFFLFRVLWFQAFVSFGHFFFPYKKIMGLLSSAHAKVRSAQVTWRCFSSSSRTLLHLLISFHFMLPPSIYQYYYSNHSHASFVGTSFFTWIGI